jgi:Ca2+-binding RTX toxin-like protein
VSGALQLTVSNGASGLIEGEVAAITARNGVAIIDNAGLVRGGDVAIFASYLDLTNSGTIEGGVRSASMSSSIENSGTITGGYQAYGGLSLLNSGTSSGDLAIDVRPAGYSSFGLTLASIDNRGAFTGDIRISGEAQFHSAPTAHAVYVTVVANSGTLTGDIVSDPTLATLAGGAVPDASFSERVTNTGTIDGNVLLGDGDDEVTNGGSITGAVELGAGQDRYEGGAGADRADGGDGDDRLAGGAGDDLLVGGLGNDYLHGGAGADGMDGGAGDDTYVVDDLRDTVTEAAGGGLDTVHSAIDYVLGADVEDLVLSGTGAIGGVGNGVRNAITGNGAANGLGGGGDDVLLGMGGADTLDGQGGDDALWGGLGHDQLMGGGGADTLDGEGGNDRVDGNAGADFVNGGLGNDNVFGGADDDRVHGGHGADLVNGHAGDDLIVGGPGSDLLVGGLGADRFLFSEGHLGGGLSATDRIKDFSSAQGDLIDFRPLDAVSTAAGDQAFTWIGNAAFSGTAGELRYNWAGNTTVVTGDRDGDGTADFALWLTGQIGLTEGDFLL